MRIQKAVFIVFVMMALLGLLAASATAQTDPNAQPTVEAPTLPSSQPTVAATPTQTFPLPITQNFNYVVQPRDTLDGIGAVFDVSIRCLRETNNLQPTDILQPEDVLVISVDCPAYDGVQRVEFPRLDAPGLTGEDGTYVVRQNDTLDTIGQRLNISAEALQIANSIENPRSLRIGDVLTIPEDAPPYGVVPAIRTLAPAETDEPGAGGTGGDDNQYVVQRGDTIDTIAQALDVSAEAIIDANNITNPRALLPGDVLVIPADAPPYGIVPPRRTLTTDEAGQGGTGTRSAQPLLEEGQYVVQPGDTLDQIGQDLDISVVALQMENNITSALSLRPGDVLNIPDDAPPYGVFPALERLSPAPESTDEAGQGGAGVEGEDYVIQPNDTLDTIARERNVSVIAIRQANNIDSALDLRPGMVIVIPEGAPAYGITPSSGQPAGATIAQGEEYVIQPGDTLDQIAESYNIDALCLLEQNQIRLEDVYYIKPGQVIGIPLGCGPFTGFYVVPPTAQVTPSGGTLPLATPTATP